MPSRKRFVKSRPIHKRKKEKPVLARVAERNEAKQQRLEYKLAEADARLNAARLASLSVPIAALSLQQPSKTHVVLAKFDENGVGAENDDSDVFPEQDEDVYAQLIDHLGQPLHESTDPKTGIKPSETAPSNRLETLKITKKPINQPPIEKQAHSQFGDEASALKDVEILFQDVELENQGAASREVKHFAQVMEKEIFSEKVIAEWPNLRLSANVTLSAAKTLRELVQGAKPVSLGVQPTTLRLWQAHDSFSIAVGRQSCSPTLRSVSAAIRAYHDLLLCAALDARTEAAVRSLYVAHCVGHVLRCRTRVIRNNTSVREGRISGGKAPTMRDQGFARARVLVIVSMRNVAYDVVNLIVQLAGGNNDRKEKGSVNVYNRNRFEEEFSPEGGVEKNKTEDDGTLQKNAANFEDFAATIRTRMQMSADHMRLFRGNVDDDFKLGISFSKKEVKLFADFYDSDIIIASPLGLRRASAQKAVGEDKHSRAMREKRKREEEKEWSSGIDSKFEKRIRDDNDNGFFSSIEICVVDGTNVMSMQNWDTLKRAMSMINKMPTCTRETDFSRVREWCLDGMMSKFRQTIVLARYKKADTMALFREFENHAGKVQLIELPQEYGSMKDVSVIMRQSFFKVPDVKSPADVPEARLKFFFEHTFPAIKALVDSQVLLIAPSYFDFVRVRNRLVKIMEEDPSFQFSSICEYSQAKDVVRARSRLFDRTVSLIVMTERFHFFWRHWIRGANTIVWYGLPENYEFYPEILNMTDEAADAGRSVQSFALYDRFDFFLLERIVGPKRCRQMTAKNSRSTYLFT